MGQNESGKGPAETHETAEQITRRLEREQRVARRRQEDQLQDSLAPFRVGSVPYLNAVPLTRGLENQIVFAPPAELARMLRENTLDAALVSVSEALFHDGYDILDGVAVASLGEVKSVFLAHCQPLEQIREISCDPASLASFNLLRVLLAERGLRPEFNALELGASRPFPENFMLIGDPALDFLRESHPHQILDLGAAWLEFTGLPFVYAVWALRRGVDNGPLRRRLREAKKFGLDTLEATIREWPKYELEFRKDYLSWHIHYHLGSDEKRGIARFAELLRRHRLGAVFEPNYVN